MAKSKKSAAQYEAGTLVAYAVVGILLIAIGLVTLLAVMGGLTGTFFTQVRRVMQGLGGSLCFFASLLMIWCGVLVAFSAQRSMPKRGFLLMTLLYLAVLAILNLLSHVGEEGLLDYFVRVNNEAVPPVPDANGYWNMIEACFGVCSRSGAFGGALGMLLAWPAWTFLGTTLGTVGLGLICLICVLLFSRFDVLHLYESVRDGAVERSAQREQQRAMREQEQMLEEQRRQTEEDERKLRTPAFARKNRNQAEAEMPLAQQPVYPPYGSMLVQPPVAMPAGAYYADPAAYPQPMAQVEQQPELYDEIVLPQGRQLPWRKGDKKGKKEKNASPQGAYQTRMTFTPREMGVEDAEELSQPGDDALILSASKRKAIERIEAIRKRKAELAAQVSESEQARLQTYAPIEPGPAAYVAEVAPPVAAPATFAAASGSIAGATPAEAMASVAAAAPVAQPAQAAAPSVTADRTAAYRRPATEKPKPIMPPAPEKKPYVYPSIDLLNTQQRKTTVDTRATDTEDATRLEKTLESFSIPARVHRVTHGPAVTRFELGLVSSGVNVKRIMGIADNIALDMAANGGVRIEVPIPGTNLFGVEVPNKEIQSVTLAEVLLSPEMKAAKSPLAVALGRDIAGKPIICDLAKMPHLLIAGQTGSGKSVCINAIINSMLFRSSPDEVRMIMIDPKVVELQCYNVVPHLLIPVVSDPHKAAGALQWAVAEMLDRYHKMQSKNVREVSAYNAKLGPGEERLPRIVIIIDELADLMLACKKEVEESIIRIAQLARAAGIHMVVATQRPTVDVITGLIKANIPSRIAFAVSSSIDSRTILDQNGAEKLLGRGDMFYFPTGANSPMRVQGCFLSDAETERVVEYIGQHSHVDFDPNVIEAMESDDEVLNPLHDADEDSGVDDRLTEAIDMVITDGQASISMLQRRMKIGYARAGRLIDDMAARGIVSKSAGSKPREVLMSREEYEKIKDTIV